MKISVSLSDADVAFLDAYAAERAVGSRSAAVQQAVGLLRASQLEVAYEVALAEWTGGSPGAEGWATLEGPS
ncbi:MAG: ribbon-helix-helix domain-containing protein [Dermatophilaceae bacterium]